MSPGKNKVEGVEEYYDMVDGKFKCKVANCTSLISSRHGFMNHICRQHHDIHQLLLNPVRAMTQEDEVLLQDFKRIVGDFDVDLHYRNTFLFNYNNDRKYLNFAYAILADDVLKPSLVCQAKKDGELCGTKCEVDKYIPSEHQLNFTKKLLPKNYDHGHPLGYRNHALNEAQFNLLHKRSMTTPQYSKLNQKYWEKLDQCSRKLKLKYDVRNLNGTHGILSYEDFIMLLEEDEDLEMDEEKFSRVTIPEFWYYIIIVHDKFRDLFKYDAYDLPNYKTNRDLHQFRVTLEEIRNATGQPFFENLPFVLEQSDLVSEADNLLYETKGELDRLKRKEIESDAVNEGLRDDNLLWAEIERQREEIERQRMEIESLRNVN